MSNDKGINGFFDATKNKNYDLAVKIAESQEHLKLKNHLSLLVNLLMEKDDISNHEVNLEIGPDSELNFIKYLILGYQSTFKDKQNNLEAYKNFSKAIKIADELKEIKLIRAAHIAMLDLFASEIFIGSKQYEPYLERFITIKENQIDEALIIFYKLIFSTKGTDNIDAQYYSNYKKLDSVFQDFSTTHAFFPIYYYEKGMFYKIEEDFNKAEDFFIKADSLLGDSNHVNNFRNKIAWQLAYVYLQKGQNEESKRYLKLSKKYSDRLREQFYENRLASFIHYGENKFDSAYHYLRKSVDIEYELGYKNNTLESSILTVQNQTDKLKLDKLELESSNNRIRNWTILLGMLLVFGTVIGILVNKNAIRKQLLAEQERTLERQKVSNILKEQELATIDAMIEGQEKERQRVANELHDDLGSLMAAVKLQFNSLEASNKKGNQETFVKTETLIDEAYGKIRAIAHAKNSGLIAKQGLLQAVNLMAEKVSVASGIGIMVHDHGLDTRLENSMELTLFRIIQELMTNVIKHAEATEMNIHITNHGDTLNILVEDNGKGMVVNSGFMDREGMGLKSIDKRINHLNGTMNMESE
ncbi:MAG: ATP-binding protein, partial [Maribacter litoralis]|uniref:tetratricopeptide repeat-containing sensor histidine kinase n=1 Tax=Maribacter litoralis TaxID=2059726 RepID=UPI003297574E